MVAVFEFIFGNLLIMTDKLSLLKRTGWAALSTCASTTAFVCVLPYIRSEAVGVIWPSTFQALLAMVLMMVGLVASRAAGRWQYVNYVLLAATFAAYVLGLKAILTVAGVSGIG